MQPEPNILSNYLAWFHKMFKLHQNFINILLLTFYNLLLRFTHQLIQIKRKKIVTLEADTMEDFSFLGSKMLMINGKK